MAKKQIDKGNLPTAVKLPSKEGKIVSFEMTQIPSVLFATGWTNHQIIRPKS